MHYVASRGLGYKPSVSAQVLTQVFSGLRMNLPSPVLHAQLSGATVETPDPVQVVHNAVLHALQV